MNYKITDKEIKLELCDWIHKDSCITDCNNCPFYLNEKRYTKEEAIAIFKELNNETK